MARDANGNYTLPLPDVVAGEVIQSTWANTTLDDVAVALTDSLDRNGRGGMLAPFQFADGVVAAPGITWGNEPTTGLYRNGTGDMRVSVQGSDVFRWTGSATQIWVMSAWANVLYAGGPGTVPDGTTADDALLWSGSAWVAGPITAEKVTYNGSDVKAELDSLNTHVNATSIHFADAPNDGTTYNRRNNAWVESIAGVSDHSALNGLGTGDDHPQYLNNARGDSRYLGLTGKAVDSTLWDGQTLVITDTDPGTYDANTIYFITE